MENIKFSDLSNAEIKIKMIEYENHYEVKKNEVKHLLEELEMLDKLYIEAKKELIKRKVLQ